jgi:hypothetical protein
MKEPARKAAAESATMTGALGTRKIPLGAADGYAEAQDLNRLDPAAGTLRGAVMTVWAGLSGQACRVGRGATGAGENCRARGKCLVRAIARQASGKWGTAESGRPGLRRRD